jgi:hypothetical protein
VSGGVPPPPLPTAQQLAWMDYEVSLMVSFDIVTSLTEVPNPQHFCIQAGGDSGFPVPPATRFAPSSDVDFTQSWVAAARAAEAKYTLLVASHCSGFFQWQSNVTLPDGSPYPYTVAQSAWKGGKGDVVADYVAASRAAGLPFGFCALRQASGPTSSPLSFLPLPPLSHLSLFLSSHRFNMELQLFVQLGSLWICQDAPAARADQRDRGRVPRHDAGADGGGVVSLPWRHH